MKVSEELRLRALRATATGGLLGLLLACGQPGPEKLVAKAQEYVAKGDHAAAVIELKNALQQAPDNGTAWLMLGRSSLATRDYVSAEKEFRRALELNQSADVVLPLLARALVEQGKHDLLLNDFGGRSLTDPEAQAAFQTLLGDAYVRRRERASAQRAYEAALKASPGYGPAQLGSVTLAALDGKTDEALARVEEVLVKSPKLAQAHAARGDLLLVKGDRKGARAAMSTALEIDPAMLAARFALVSMMAEDGELDDAEKLLREGRKYSGRDLRIEYLEATLAFRRGNADKARQHLQQVLKYMPEHVPSLVLAGAIELRAKELPAAEENLRKAVARAPGHDGARQLLVQTYLRMGQPAKAKDTLQPLLEKGMPTNPQLLLLAGETYLANGDPKEASTYYQAATSTGQSQGAAARTRLGQIALATGNAEEGFRELEAAAELDAGQYQADLAIIAGHLRRNEFDKAMVAVQALEKKQPKNPLTFQMYGVVNMAKRDIAAARRSFEKALELQANYLPAAYNLAQLDLAEKKPEDARKRYEAMIAKDSKNDQLYLALADLQVRTGGDAKTVAETLQRAVAANPQSVAARLALVNFHLRSGDVKAALTAAQNAAAAMPTDPRILDATGVALAEAGEVNQAIETFQKLAGLLPKAAQPQLRLAALYAKQKDTSRAADALRRAQKLSPKPNALVPQLVQVYMAGNRPDEALKEARDLQKSEPKSAAGFALEGDIYASQRKFAQAEKAYREALQREPKADGFAVRLHASLANGGKGAEADALARKWLADNPRSIAMRMYLGERELVTKDYKAAAAQYQGALAIDPNNALALNNLAWISGQLGDPKAITYAERALKIAPNNAAILDTYGMLLLKNGDTAKALEQVSRAAALAPGRYDIRLNHARVLASAGQKDKARKELEALQSVPDDFPGKSEIPAMIKAL